MISSFFLAKTPQVYFGSGKISVLPEVASLFGHRLLLVTGTRSFSVSGFGEKILNSLEEKGFEIRHYRIENEPSPADVDEAVKEYGSFDPQLVISVGGGSVMDAGKAIAAMLPLKDSVRNYLEGVGTKRHDGTKIPYVAIPTTAGTGSEATKNAVLSETGVKGFKKSLRHDNFVPDIAIIDPSLTLSCPSRITAMSGMDAFTQLLESYLSTSANAFTDGIALQGLTLVARSLTTAFDRGTDIGARADMALAAYFSGITLANAGLGTVHGIAGAVGGFYKIPHGLICSALMSPINKITVRKLRASDPFSPALQKYAVAGKLFNLDSGKPDAYHIDYLLHFIEENSSKMNVAKISVAEDGPIDLKKIIDSSDNKNNPVKLTNEEMHEALESVFT